jgi:hypothetical protein
MGEMRSAYNTLVEKYVEKRPLGRYKLRWESNIRMDLMERVWEDMARTHVAQEWGHWRYLVHLQTA